MVVVVVVQHLKLLGNVRPMMKPGQTKALSNTYVSDFNWLGDPGRSENISPYLLSSRSRQCRCPRDICVNLHCWWGWPPRCSSTQCRPCEASVLEALELWMVVMRRGMVMMHRHVWPHFRWCFPRCRPCHQAGRRRAEDWLFFPQTWSKVLLSDLIFLFLSVSICFIGLGYLSNSWKLWKL